MVISTKMVVNTLLQINETNRISNVYVHFITHREWTPTLQVLQKSTGLVFQSSSYFLISYLEIFLFIFYFIEFNTHVEVVVFSANSTKRKNCLHSMLLFILQYDTVRHYMIDMRYSD